MQNEGNMEDFARSLSFEVEAIPQDNVNQLNSTTNRGPINVKIKVRKKKSKKSARNAVITIPKIGRLGPERVRLNSSNQTLMSFNVFMEDADEKQVKQKLNKSLFRFFKPAGSFEKNDDEEFNMIVNDRSQKKLGILGNCKPGGCLDPPFGEDKYSYEIAKNKQSGVIKPLKANYNENDPVAIKSLKTRSSSDLTDDSTKNLKKDGDEIKNKKEYNESGGTYLTRKPSLQFSYSKSKLTEPTPRDQQIDKENANEQSKDKRPSCSDSSEIYYPKKDISKKRSKIQGDKKDTPILSNLLLSQTDDFENEPIKDMKIKNKSSDIVKMAHKLKHKQNPSERNNEGQSVPFFSEDPTNKPTLSKSEEVSTVNVEPKLKNKETPNTIKLDDKNDQQPSTFNKTDEAQTPIMLNKENNKKILPHTLAAKGSTSDNIIGRKTLKLEDGSNIIPCFTEPSKVFDKSSKEEDKLPDSLVTYEEFRSRENDPKLSKSNYEQPYTETTEITKITRTTTTIKLNPSKSAKTFKEETGLKPTINDPSQIQQQELDKEKSNPRLHRTYEQSKGPDNEQIKIEVSKQNKIPVDELLKTRKLSKSNEDAINNKNNRTDFKYPSQLINDRDDLKVPKSKLNQNLFQPLDKDLNQSFDLTNIKRDNYSLKPKEDVYEKSREESQFKIDKLKDKKVPAETGKSKNISGAQDEEKMQQKYKPTSDSLHLRDEQLKTGPNISDFTIEDSGYKPKDKIMKKDSLNQNKEPTLQDYNNMIRKLSKSIENANNNEQNNNSVPTDNKNRLSIEKYKNREDVTKSKIIRGAQEEGKMQQINKPTEDREDNGKSKIKSVEQEIEKMQQKYKPTSENSNFTDEHPKTGQQKSEFEKEHSRHTPKHNIWSKELLNPNKDSTVHEQVSTNRKLSQSIEDITIGKPNIYSGIKDPLTKDKYKDVIRKLSKSIEDAKNNKLINKSVPSDNKNRVSIDKYKDREDIENPKIISGAQEEGKMQQIIKPTEKSHFSDEQQSMPQKFDYSKDDPDYTPENKLGKKELLKQSTDPTVHEHVLSNRKISSSIEDAMKNEQIYNSVPTNDVNSLSKDKFKEMTIGKPNIYSDIKDPLTKDKYKDMMRREDAKNNKQIIDSVPTDNKKRLSIDRYKDRKDIEKPKIISGAQEEGKMQQIIKPTEKSNFSDEKQSVPQKFDFSKDDPDYTPENKLGKKELLKQSTDPTVHEHVLSNRKISSSIEDAMKNEQIYNSVPTNDVNSLSKDKFKEMTIGKPNIYSDIKDPLTKDKYKDMMRREDAKNNKQIIDSVPTDNKNRLSIDRYKDREDIAKPKIVSGAQEEGKMQEINKPTSEKLHFTHEQLKSGQQPKEDSDYTPENKLQKKELFNQNEDATVHDQVLKNRKLSKPVEDVNNNKQINYNVPSDNNAKDNEQPLSKDKFQDITIGMPKYDENLSKSQPYSKEEIPQTSKPFNIFSEDDNTAKSYLDSGFDSKIKSDNDFKDRYRNRTESLIKDEALFRKKKNAPEIDTNRISKVSLQPDYEKISKLRDQMSVEKEKSKTEDEDKWSRPLLGDMFDSGKILKDGDLAQQRLLPELEKNITAHDKYLGNTKARTDEPIQQENSLVENPNNNLEKPLTTTLNKDLNQGQRKDLAKSSLTDAYISNFVRDSENSNKSFDFKYLLKHDNISILGENSDSHVVKTPSQTLNKESDEEKLKTLIDTNRELYDIDKNIIPDKKQLNLEIKEKGPHDVKTSDLSKSEDFMKINRAYSTENFREEKVFPQQPPIEDLKITRQDKNFSFQRDENSPTYSDKFNKSIDSADAAYSQQLQRGSQFDKQFLSDTPDRLSQDQQVALFNENFMKGLGSRNVSQNFLENTEHTKPSSDVQDALRRSFRLYEKQKKFRKPEDNTISRNTSTENNLEKQINDWLQRSKSNSKDSKQHQSNLTSPTGSLVDKYGKWLQAQDEQEKSVSFSSEQSSSSPRVPSSYNDYMKMKYRTVLDNKPMLLDLSFQSYVNENNQRVLKSIQDDTPIKNNNGKVITVKSLVRPNISTIKVPIDFETELSLSIKKQEKKKMDYAIREDIERHNIKLSQKRSEEILPRTLSLVYEEQLLPLQNIIKKLQGEIDTLATQQQIFRQNLAGSKKPNFIRVIPYNKKCGCRKYN